VKLADVIDTVFAMLKDKADKKGLFLQKSLPTGPAVISADRDRVVQILLNLVDNGIKFTEKGGVTVGFEMSGDVPALFVEDTGVGIPASHLPRLGERFYRVDRARSREMGGTGLGLAIVKHLVKAHDWDMAIESAPGNGTKVKLLIV
jgi:two-component system phosphate regulon sensor histidine kinase PhoR